MNGTTYDKFGNGNVTYVELRNGHDFAIRVDYMPSESAGVIVLIVTSAISLIAVLALLGAIAVSGWLTRRASHSANLFLRTHVAVYFINLLLCDILQAIGSIMNMKWVMAQAVQYGPFCQYQGTIKHIADIGTAMWTLIIAIHTFNVLFLEIVVPRYVMFATLAGGWAITGTLVIGGPAALDTVKNGPFFAISGFWCWISPEYPSQRITLDYMEMFIAAFSCFILYVLVFLRLRGNIVRENGTFMFRRKGYHPDSGTREERFGREIAKRMVWYPVAYTCLLLPIAISRFIDWTGHDVPFQWTIFSDVVFLLSGVVNVGMFWATRNTLPSAPPPSVSAPVLQNSTLDVLPDGTTKAESSRWSLDAKSITSVRVDVSTPLGGRFFNVPV